MSGIKRPASFLPAIAPPVVSVADKLPDHIPTEFPPILQLESWTRGVPFKELSFHHTPSESIANNYTPSVQHLKIKNLTRRKTEFPEMHRLSFYSSAKFRGCRGSKKNEEYPICNESRPSSPEEQLKIINESREAIPEAIVVQVMRRYNHYMESGIEQPLLEPLDLSLQKRLFQRISRKLKSELRLRRRAVGLLAEIEADYYRAVKKSIVDYVLLDPNEQMRLAIPAILSGYRCGIVRSPVPWKASVHNARNFCKQYLFVSNPILVTLCSIWNHCFSSLVFLDVNELKEGISYRAGSLVGFVQNQCQKARDIFINEWLPAAADVFAIQREDWAYMVPLHGDFAEQADRFFVSVAAFMSCKVRAATTSSLTTFLDYVDTFKFGNSYSTERELKEFIHLPLLKIELMAENHDIVFKPSLVEAKQELIQCIYVIVRGNQQLPRVEKVMFPEMKDLPMYVSPLHENEELVDACVARFSDIFDVNEKGPLLYIRKYAKYLHLISSESESEIETLLNQGVSLSKLKQKLEWLDSISGEIALLPSYVSLNLICLSVAQLHDQLYSRVRVLQNRIVEHFVIKNRDVNQRLCGCFEEMCARAGETPTTTAELVELSDYLRNCKNLIAYELKEDIDAVAKNLLFLIDYAVLSAEDLALNNRVFNWPQNIRTMIEMSKARIDMRQDQIEADLRKRLMYFDSRVLACSRELEALQKRDPTVLNLEEIKTSLQILQRLTTLLEEAKQELTSINEEERLLGDEPSKFPILQTMMAVKEPYEKLWTTALSFTEKYEVWFGGPFKDLDADLITEEVDTTWRTLYKLTKAFSDQPGPKRVAENIKGRVEKFRQQLPVLQMICNAGMRERHWKIVGEIVGRPLSPNDDSSLAEMIEAGLPHYVQRMEEISVVASKEHSLEQSLGKMKSEWKDVHFDLVPYRETGVSILSAVDDIQLMMDDHILRVQTIRSSPYIKPLEADVKDWEEKLILMQDILDSWLKCQATWMYLEPIFGSEDIVKQMPVESRKFLRVDQTWREIVAAVINDSRALVATSVPYMLQKLEENNRLLEEIQKGLNDYLDKKRLFFPRFFFLSNDELLEILSETKDPTRVQPHLKKCFEGINRLQFGDEQEILAMISIHEESVAFAQPIYPAASKGLVEKWLAQVEAAMVASLMNVTAKAIESSRDQPPSEWALRWPGQVVLCTQCVRWTAEVAAGIRTCSLAAARLRDWGRDFVAQSTAQLDRVVELLHRPLETGPRITLGALIVISVHARDVVGQLIDEDVRDVSDFAWVSHLRYYNEAALGQDGPGRVTVRMVHTEMSYGFEYLGNSSRLVITPLTDRCYRTLLSALKLNLGGAPEGPAGTGKTETVKDLAKAVAKQCIVFNCSEGVDYQAMGKFFKGLVQAGAWACFDEFDRIDVEVLSVISQQIQSIQLAKSQGRGRFMFEGTELTLDPTCAVFVTMNPGYSGRRELPNNLRASFRTVSMMVPDYAIIAEISLYSCGYTEARGLASKIVFVYRLCSEQLSPQPHYDYGMRTIKAVLLTAASLKLRHPQETEAVLVLKALRDVNCPKFLAEDVVLFEGIVSDLFADVEQQPSDQSTLKLAVVGVLQEWNLQPVPSYVDKILQIYDTMLVRHGVMVVGEPLTGKTTSYRVLAEALARLEDGSESRVTYRVINPKALTVGQLYGSFDPASCEWKDGVLARSFREFATGGGGGDDRKWIVFDGPVDTVWVENMNTVLDDNRKLCLMNGEIIQMPEEMTLVFECADLDHASPATVSRCGMIYLEPRHVGWRPLKDSYLERLPPSVDKVQRRMISDMFEWLLPPTLDFVQRHCQSFMPIHDMHSVASTIRMYDLLLEVLQATDEGSLALQSQQVTNWLQCLLLFAMVWGLAGALTRPSRSSFDAFFRDLIYGQNELHMRPTTFRLSRLQMFPEKQLVFDYAFECKGNGQWVSWTDIVGKDQYKLPSTMGSELIIGTSETARHTFFLSKCVSRKIPLLLVGPSGTGKSFVTNAYLSSLPRDAFVVHSVGFSARSTVDHTQDMVMSRLDRRRKGVYGPPLGRKCIVFVDNLHLPTRERSGCQPPVELLRQWLDHGHWYDRKDASSLELVDTTLVSAMHPVTRNEVSPRFLRHFHTLSVDALDDRSLVKIFTSMMDWHFGHGFDPAILQMAKVAVQALLSVYKAVTTRLLPTPSKSHYVFNLRDLTRTVRGMFLVPPTHLLIVNKFVRLWIHEVYRVFHDRLVDDKDRGILFEIVKTTCQREFRQDLDVLLAPLCPEGTVTESHVDDLFFSDCVETEGDRRVYDEIADVDAMMEAMDNYLKEFNALSPTPLTFVPFRYALKHVFRIGRVLLQPRGHLLLLGIDGSGRRTATRMAAFIANMELHQVEMSKNYTLADWRDDVKRTLRRAGVDGRPLVFMFGDDQMKDETFLDELNTILTGGDLPNLYTGEEKAEILEKMQAVARELGENVDSSPASLYDYYVSRVQHNLHVVLTMSPTGDAFRTRIRIFPALIGCCTIDFFTDWPQEALEMVARKFIGDVELDPMTVTRCVTVSRLFHETVGRLSERYFVAWNRRTYVTPTSFLELILTFQQLLARKRTEIQALRNRYVTGVEKLDFAAAQVTVMQDELTAERPKLIATTEETERLMIKIERDTIEVEAKKEVVAADEALANAAAAEAQAIKDECENDLAEATPAMESAIAALNTLKPQDITVIKSMKNPPSGIKLVMEAICIMKGIRPERKPDPGGTGKMIEDYWSPSQKLLGDLKFLDGLKAYDKDRISPNVMKVIRNKYVSNPEFDPFVIRSVSTACEGLCRWICAIEVYDRVAKIVAPKKEKLRKAASDLGRQMEKLNAKRSQLQEVTDKLQIFNDEFIKKTKEKKDLEDRIELCCKKLDRAEKLIGGLGGEKHRWSSLASDLAIQYGNVVGDSLLASGFVVYLGVFTAELRQQCLDEWLQLCDQHSLPCSRPYSLVVTLGNPVQIREWIIAGLPVDNFSTDNALVVSHSRRWPLMIDPQGQANRWIKCMEKDRQLEVMKMSDPNYLRTLECCIQLGHPALLEDVDQELDPALQPLLARQTFKQGLVECIRLSDSIVEYHPDFFLYITTRLQNPHYTPEISVKVTLLNFTITPIGLEDQLLGLLVAKEKPDLEERKNELIVEGAGNRRQLQEIEDKILEVLSTAEGNILEDETAISVLSSSKVLSEQIKAKQEATASTECAIDETRNLYRPVATNASTLFFCISELAHVEPMYQYSLDWFVAQYLQSIGSCPKSSDMKQRMAKINELFTINIYRSVCRSLFEKDRMVFSCILCLTMLRSKGQMDDAVWKFILTGGLALDNPHPNPAPIWLTDKSWNEIVRASVSLPKLRGFMEHVIEHCLEWKKVYDSNAPHSMVFPHPWDRLTGLERVAVIRCLRSDQLVKAIQELVATNLGPAYVESPAFDLAESYADSNCCTPLIFVLSPGADPMDELLRYGLDQGYLRDRIHTLSMGQDQGPVAQQLIEAAVENGSWVVLQNCHLVTGWLPTLEKICQETIVPRSTHRSFRLWLTSYPCREFPIFILQNGIKMTIEPPRGLRANLLRSYAASPVCDPSFYSSCNHRQRQWQRLLYGLCFFHGVVQERKNFGSLGWNVPYEFCDSDLRISMLQLKMLMNESREELPLKALVYLTGELNYGGRVTDENDRRLLLSLLSNFYCSEAASSGNYPLFIDHAYCLPSTCDYESVMDFIRGLPSITPPSVFGLHENASIVKNKHETSQLLGGLSKMRPHQSNIWQPSAAQCVLDLAADILGKLPSDVLDWEMVREKYPVTHERCSNTVLQREVASFARLCDTIVTSLVDLQKAIRGQIVMSAELEEVFESLLEGVVPRSWAIVSYPSLKPLAGYVVDLVSRVKFFQNWIDEGRPPVVWITALFFPQTFITGVMQDFARKRGISIDSLTLDCEILDENIGTDDGSSDEAYIRGLYLEGARWDRTSMRLAESLTRILYDPLPPIWLKPRLHTDCEPSATKARWYYRCPVYKTSLRQGEPSTTGRSTNYIFSINLPTDCDPKHWIDRGVACLCQLDD